MVFSLTVNGELAEVTLALANKTEIRRQPAITHQNQNQSLYLSHPATYDPTFEDFACIMDAFEAYLASRRVLLDDVALPSDGGERITASIVGGTAGVVSDDSFDPEGRHGSSSFTVAATQDALMRNASTDRTT